jgi:FMN-dependent NADH-azoreductase
MSKVLYIQASPRGKRSHSIAVADRFLAEYKVSHPQDEVATLNVSEMVLPAFDGFVIQAKYTLMHGGKYTPQEAAAWKFVEDEIARFKSFDKYVFAVPMWNFGIPYRLKQYIDIIVQPTYTFAITPDGAYQGLVTGKRAFVAYARGGEYPAGMAAYDHQKPYMELILGFMGITDVRSVLVEPMLADPKIAQYRQDKALEAATTMAKSF